MSFAVKNCVKKDVNGRFRLLSQGNGRVKNVASVSSGDGPAGPQPYVMANQSESSVEELVSVEELCEDSDLPPTPHQGAKQRKRISSSNKDYGKVIEDYIFLRYLELDPADETGAKRGRTPFTSTRLLKRHPGTSYGFSIAWTHPPRVERVESGLPADQAGLRPGDYIIFVDKSNVVTMKEDQILEIIKSCGNQLVMESYRKAANSWGGARPPTACSAATTTASVEVSKKRLHLPQVAFSSEGLLIGEEEARKKNLYQLVEKEQNFAVALQFGMVRFLLPLAERKDLISTSEHSTLFQNAQELLRITEDILELFMQDDALWNAVGRIYLKKMNQINSCYRKYWLGVKKSYSLLLEKSKQTGFYKFTNEPPVPHRRPDLTTFLHRPIEHFREVLKQLQLIMNSTKTRNDDYLALSKVVHDMQASYREMTSESGLMEPDGEGRPLLSLPDLESRLVFTRCKPFTLSAPGRQWIFGGDLSRVEGRSVRQFWALLFTDLLVFAKVSRDRVLFVTEEPLPLSTVSQALFSIRKKATEFRLLVSNKLEKGEDSPATGVCAELSLTRTPKGPRRRTLALRAPSPELKAVWQNLIQRQIVYLSSGRGGTPASSPLDSPDPMTADSLDSICPRKQQLENRGLSELIENRCKQLSKSALSRGSALHLSQWMRGELGGGGRPESEPEPEVWTRAALRRREEEIRSSLANSQEDFQLSDPPSVKSTDESQRTVKSTAESPEKLIAVCRKCQKTCLLNTRNSSHSESDINANRQCEWDRLAPTDPFQPIPQISVLPPSPTYSLLPTSENNNTTAWHDSNFTRAADDDDDQSKESHVENGEGDESDGEVEETPYRSLSPCLKRYGTVSSLERLDSQPGQDALPPGQTLEYSINCS